MLYFPCECVSKFHQVKTEKKNNCLVSFAAQLYKQNVITTSLYSPGLCPSFLHEPVTVLKYLLTSSNLDICELWLVSVSTCEYGRHIC